MSWVEWMTCSVEKRISVQVSGILIWLDMHILTGMLECWREWSINQITPPLLFLFLSHLHSFLLSLPPLSPSLLLLRQDHGLKRWLSG